MRRRTKNGEMGTKEKMDEGRVKRREEGLDHALFGKLYILCSSLYFADSGTYVENRDRNKVCC
jgi:hypothetical protein